MHYLQVQIKSIPTLLKGSMKIYEIYENDDGLNTPFNTCAIIKRRPHFL